VKSDYDGRSIKGARVSRKYGLLFIINRRYRPEERSRRRRWPSASSTHRRRIRTDRAVSSGQGEPILRESCRSGRGVPTACKTPRVALAQPRVDCGHVVGGAFQLFVTSLPSLGRADSEARPLATLVLCQMTVHRRETVSFWSFKPEVSAVPVFESFA
jgi:hypothetical protein